MSHLSDAQVIFTAWGLLTITLVCMVLAAMTAVHWAWLQLRRPQQVRRR